MEKPAARGVGAAGSSKLLAAVLGQVRAPRFASPSRGTVTPPACLVNRPLGPSLQHGGVHVSPRKMGLPAHSRRDGVLALFFVGPIVHCNQDPPFQRATAV